MTTALLLTLALVGGNRIHPRDEGVNLVFNPTRFAYTHEYKFENLKEDARSVYFLLPRNCQEHTILSSAFTVGGKPLDYKVVSETPGWQVARAEVPLSRNFSVFMQVSGIHWGGKLSRQRSTLPADIAPPPVSDEKMAWYDLTSPFVSRVQPQFSDLLKANGLDNLGGDFVSAMTRSYRFMAQRAKFVDGAANIEEFLKGQANCNGSNRTLSAIFDLDRSGEYVAAEMNGIVMEGAGIHAMSLVGKKHWRYLVPTDGVKFNLGNMDPVYLSGHCDGWAMLLFQESFGDAEKDPKGGVTFFVQEAGRVARAPNPGGMMFAYPEKGNNLAYIGGSKVSFAQTPVTDFAALRRELAAAQGGNR